MAKWSSGLANKSDKYRDAIKDKYPNAVIGEFKDGKVTFQYSKNGKEYTYKANNTEELANKLGGEIRHRIRRK